MPHSLHKEILALADLRNYHTHFEPELEMEIPAPEERPGHLHDLSVRLQHSENYCCFQRQGSRTPNAKSVTRVLRRLDRRLAMWR
jgi:hypothetical protein